MTDDDTYPWEWLGDPPDPRDPRLGEALEEWQPTAAQRARAAELVYQYMTRAPTFETMFLNYCDDCLRERSLPQALLAFLEHFAVTLIGCQGEKLAIARLAEDVEMARDDVLKFGELQ